MADNRPGLDEEQRQQAKLLWDYHQMHHDLRPADAAIGLGSHDFGVPAYCAELYRAGLFPVLVFSGGPNPTAPERFPRGEAVHFREHATALGVPEAAILVEPNATNTGQNITLSRQVMAEAGIEPSTVMLIAMPYMERRSYATARKVWPEARIICASQPTDFDDYLKAMGDECRVAEMLVGDLQRVIEYPKLGFAIEQDVPGDVHDAYQALVRDGFTNRLLAI
ncbi:YdcF family protein [Peterkaempfera bronchialis]|uniref:YdcF family protein n=1 Tax=Peterkaempfera bronchialis TaxID=2126346 RepID=A0A345SWJ1_9ACTN|nr:YdcF family protein [Peterkaempfera bronchialis]AXI78096.1 YdcF family protein [Peterkaempfera bronchialis]